MDGNPILIIEMTTLEHQLKTHTISFILCCTFKQNKEVANPEFKLHERNEHAIAGANKTQIRVFASLSPLQIRKTLGNVT